MRNLTLALSPLIASSLTTAGQAQVMQSGPKKLRALWASSWGSRRQSLSY